MKRAHFNFIIDAIAFAGFVFLTSTGVLMRYLLPPGSGRFATLWGLDRHQWGAIHFWVSVVFFAILALHLLLHWRWIVGLLSGRATEESGLRLGLGLVGVLTLIALAAAPLIAPIEISGAPGRQIQRLELDIPNIQGSMNLADIERTTGVPADYLIERLKLPETTSKKARLGQLRKRHGFTLSDVRKAVAEYQQ